MTTPITWNHTVDLGKIEVEDWEGLTVKAYLFDTISVDDELGVVVDRGTPEIEIGRKETEGEDTQVPMRFEVANARRVAAAIIECCDAVEGKSA